MRLFFLSMVVFFFSAPVYGAEGKSIYDRVSKTKEIRCGYVLYKPLIQMNLNTKELFGVTVDFVEEIASDAGFRVSWHEINIEQIVSSLENGRIDMVCVPIIPDENWKKRLEFVGNFGYFPYYLYVKKGKNFKKEDIADKRFVVSDGYYATSLTYKLFPNASYVSLMQLSSQAEIYDQLRYNKADIVVNEHVSAGEYMKNNPGLIEKFSDDPIEAPQTFFGTAKGDVRMAAFISEHFNVRLENNKLRLNRLILKHTIPSDIISLERRAEK